MPTLESAAPRGSWLTRQRVPVGEISLPRVRREAALGIVYALLYAAVAIVIGVLIRWHPWPIWGAARFNQDVWYALVYKIGLLLILPLFVFFRAGYRTVDLLLGWSERRVRLVWLPLAWAVGVCANAGHLPGIAKAAASRPAWEAAARIAIGMALPLFTAALPEEIFFRGFLQTRLTRLWGRLPAILTTAILFTAFHVPSRFLLSHGFEGEAGSLGSVLLGTALPVFVMGLLLGIAWDRFGNLPALIGLHWGVDILPAVSSMLGLLY